MPGPDYIVEIQGLAGRDEPSEEGSSPTGGPRPRNPRISRSSHHPSDRAQHHGRPWLAVHWKCCNSYSRIYRNADATAYTGQCPKCGAAVYAAIGTDGTTARFFEAR